MIAWDCLCGTCNPLNSQTCRSCGRGARAGRLVRTKHIPQQSKRPTSLKPIPHHAAGRPAATPGPPRGNRASLRSFLGVALAYGILKALFCPAVVVTWQERAGGMTLGTLRNCAGYPLRNVTLTLPIDVPAEYRGFSIGTRRAEVPAQWPSAAERYLDVPTLDEIPAGAESRFTFFAPVESVPVSGLTASAGPPGWPRQPLDVFQTVPPAWGLMSLHFLFTLSLGKLLTLCLVMPPSMKRSSS